eukprot:CAMPEP_0174283440 /NCGR_PEP_ID=MMETSP0809-20121228/4147_1 /TAXON_ID=73025 ORGANISM="Eutreptiella gymnastica-like, Strain CCMP1594" /NCGR_SAMPLE_ID=MMETSP0809 /ASSEMBLY_ACC=CAM_ASM_000658 /LENGTH=74 /DNA_ID=CAMNT_0015378381 /DNA_START=67 /DNA_END=291 /DNA_ORIENTATION=+
MSEAMVPYGLNRRLTSWSPYPAGRLPTYRLLDGTEGAAGAGLASWHSMGDVGLLDGAATAWTGSCEEGLCSDGG